MAATVDPKDIKVYQGSSDWSALYVEGKLVRVGDHYLIDEKIYDLLNIETISSDDFMRGGNQESDVAQTLEEIKAYEELLQAAEDEADELISQAEELERRAKEIREQAKGRSAR